MARIFKDCFQMVREVDRELAVCGITVPVTHYQNKPLEGEDRNTKELIGVTFCITNPTTGWEDMLKFLFKDEAEKIMEYCKAEFEDRLNPEGVNPGKSWLVRADLWQKLMSKGFPDRFDYTYSERINPVAPWAIGPGERFSQITNVVEALSDDIHSRRAMIMVFDKDDTLSSKGAETRIPCSVSYQFLIRNNRLHCIYYIRSNDYFKHFAIDIILTAMMMRAVVGMLSLRYPELKVGPLHYFAGSLHAYNEDLHKWVIF